MIDKPIPAKILLTLIDPSDTGEVFISLSGSLYRQNLIYSEPRELRRKDNTLELSVIFRDIASYKNWQSDNYIEEYWNKKFTQLLAELPKTVQEMDVIIEVDGVRNCTCKKSDFFILQGRSIKFVDELSCNNCLGQIPYSRVPNTIKIEDWQTKYERFYSNWLESGLFEKESYKELTNYKKGKLNKEGEKIRQQLSDFFKIPVYMAYFVEEPDDNNMCVICGNDGIESGLIKPSKICKKCNTIFDYLKE